LRTNFPEDWEHYHFLEVVHKPGQMEPGELMEAMWENWDMLYNHRTIQKKMLQTLKNTRDTRAAAWSYISNVERHNAVFGGKRPPIDPELFLKGINPE
jgi:hypothetical protein